MVAYPVSLTIAWAERQSRWQALFRLILAIPALLLGLLFAYFLYPVIFLMWVVVLIRGRPPPWMFAFVLGAMRVLTRVYAYFFLLTDKYVVFEGEHPVTLEIEYPDRISRWQLVFWKLIVSVPHMIALQFIYTAALAVSFVGWISILFGGTYPKGLHEFATGCMRWYMRVVAYLISMTDVFPPFSIDADAPRASSTAYRISAAVGVVVTTMFAGLLTWAIVTEWPDDEHAVAVDYQRLLSDDVPPGEYAVHTEGVVIDLVGADEPVDPLPALIDAGLDSQFVTFELVIDNFGEIEFEIWDEDFEIEDGLGSDARPLFVSVDRQRTPVEVHQGDSFSVTVLAEVAAGLPPRELRYTPFVPDADFLDRGALFQTLVYEFE